MKTDAAFTRPIRAEETSRQIALRTRGRSHGSLTRLVSPGDIGELIKPRAYQRRFFAHWGEQHRRYWPPAAQPGCLGTRQTLRIGEIGREKRSREQQPEWLI
jgi:hypothetical protein